MRLGQLSRKVNVKPTEILSYLKNEFDVELGTHLNTKIEDELANKVIAKFVVPVIETVEPKATSSAPETFEEPVIVPETTNEVIVVDTPTEETLSETIPKPAAPVEFEPHQEVNPETILNAELIKAPKVELPGPKVIGKIELPPTLEEQMVEIDGVMISKAELANRKKEERKEKREKHVQRKTRTSGSARNSRLKSEEQLMQLKRDSEAKDMAVRLERREKRIATKKKESQKVKPAFIAKPAKKKVTKAVQIKEKQKTKKPEPKTWHGKLWKWFNT